MVIAHGDHRLHGQSHAGTQPGAMARFSEVGHAGLLMHRTADAVAGKVTDHAVAEALGIGLNGVADIPKMIAVYGLAHTLVKALLRDLDELAVFLADGAHAHGKGAV